MFDTIFRISALLEMDEEPRDKILENMTTERDLKNQFDNARKEGHENARNFKHLGVPIDIICQATGLSSEVVEGL